MICTRRGSPAGRGQTTVRLLRRQNARTKKTMVNNSPAAMSTEKRNSHPIMRTIRSRVCGCSTESRQIQKGPDQVSIQVKLFVARARRRTCSTHRAIKSVYSTRGKRGDRGQVQRQNRSGGRRGERARWQQTTWTQVLVERARPMHRRAVTLRDRTRDTCDMLRHRLPNRVVTSRNKTMHRRLGKQNARAPDKSKVAALTSGNRAVHPIVQFRDRRPPKRRKYSSVAKLSAIPTAFSSTTTSSSCPCTPPLPHHDCLSSRPH